MKRPLEKCIKKLLATATDEQRTAIDEFMAVLEKDGDSGSIHSVLQTCIDMSGIDYVQACLNTIRRSS